MIYRYKSKLKIGMMLMNQLFSICILFNLNKKLYSTATCKCNLINSVYCCNVDKKFLGEWYFTEKLCVIDINAFTEIRNHKEFKIVNGFIFYLESLNKIGENLEKITIIKCKVSEIPSLVNMRALISLEISENFLTELNDTDVFPDSLKSINLKENRISVIHKDCFKNLKRLNYLNLENNLLTTVDLSFNFIINTPIKIHLSKNPLISPSMLVFWAKIEDYLSNDYPVSFYFESNEYSLKHVPNIENKNDVAYKIYLKIPNEVGSSGMLFCLIYDKHTATFQMNSVDNDSIDINQNYFNSFRKKLNLKIVKSKIKKIPMVNQVVNLKDFYLDENLIGSLINSSVFPSKIETISLDSNKIDFVDEKYFSDFKNLRSVSLKNNLIKNLKKLIFNSNRLKVIDLSNNIQLDLNELIFLNNEYLDGIYIGLRSNNLSKIPKIIGNLNSIQDLIVSEQRSDSFNALNFKFDHVRTQTGKLLKIENFDISSNRIEYYEKDLFCNLNTNLAILNLRLRENKLDNRFICQVVNQLYPSTEINIEFYPQKSQVSKCSDLNKVSIFNMKSQNIIINCQYEELGVGLRLSCENLKNYACQKLKFNSSFKHENFYANASAKSNDGISVKNTHLHLNFSYVFLSLKFLYFLINKFQ